MMLLALLAIGLVVIAAFVLWLVFSASVEQHPPKAGGQRDLDLRRPSGQ